MEKKARTSLTIKFCVIEGHTVAWKNYRRTRRQNKHNSTKNNIVSCFFYKSEIYHPRSHENHSKGHSRKLMASLFICITTRFVTVILLFSVNLSSYWVKAKSSPVGTWVWGTCVSENSGNLSSRPSTDMANTPSGIRFPHGRCWCSTLSS